MMARTSNTCSSTLARALGVLGGSACSSVGSLPIAAAMRDLAVNIMRRCQTARVLWWEIGLEHVDGPVRDCELLTPRSAEVTAFGCFLLGEHDHTDPIKPRSLRVVMPAPGRPGSLALRWLSDAVEPPHDPVDREDAVYDLGGTRVRIVKVVPTAAVELLDALEDGLDDPVMEVELRLLTPAVLPQPKDPPDGTLDLAELVRSIANRWDDYRRWRPGSRRDDATALVPDDVREELAHGLSLVRLTPPAVGRVQVKWDRRRRRAYERTAWQADLRLRLHPYGPDTSAWWSALCVLLAWDGLGSYTQGGLGQVEVTPVVRLGRPG